MKRWLIVCCLLLLIGQVAASIRDRAERETRIVPIAPAAGAMAPAARPQQARAGTTDSSKTASTTTWPPANPALSPSGWPIFHANTYAQASTPLRGPEPGDRIEVQFIATPGNNVSPWTVLSPPDARGAQAAWGSSSTHVFKAMLHGETFRMVDSIALPRNRLSFDWNIALLRDGRLVTTNKATSSFVLIGEERPGDAASPIRIVKTLRVPVGSRNLSSHFSIAYDGWIIFLTNDDRLGALDPDSGRTVLFPLGSSDGDFGGHNAFAIDERGAIHLLSERAMTRVDWDGRAFRLVWRAAYDFRGPGCASKPTGRIRQAIAVARGQPCTGSGTTPTLLGTPHDGLVVAVDGHRPANRAVAFWRDAPPADWTGLPGQDRRVAAILPLPHSTPDGDGFSMENSPTVAGWALAASQWNGFQPGCNPLPGVQKWRWDPAARRMVLIWSNGGVHMNGVLTHAAGSGLVYQSGRRDCVYRLYALDWRSGEVVLDLPMGDDERFLDQGNQIVPTADRSLLFGSKRGLVRVRPIGARPI
jgi:hypothetical protein